MIEIVEAKFRVMLHASQTVPLALATINSGAYHHKPWRLPP
jgi:hypothetical protein